MPETAARSRRSPPTCPSPDYVRKLLKGFLTEQREPLTLHLNADNPTIQKLAARA